jgi:hypothetical protein
VQGFIIGADGKVNGARVSTGATNVASGTVPAAGLGSVETLGFPGAVGNDEVMCLVQIPEQYQTITRQVLKTPATVTEVNVPTEYGTVTHTKCWNALPQRKKLKLQAALKQSHVLKLTLPQ